MPSLPNSPFTDIEDFRVAVDAPVSTDLMTDIVVDLNYLLANSQKKRLEVIYANGNFTLPNDVSNIVVEIQGAGGGGGGGGGASTAGATGGNGGGGGGGAFQRFSLVVTPGETLAAVIGAFGAGGAGGNATPTNGTAGGNGGNSTLTGTFGVATATGGLGGGGGQGSTGTGTQGTAGASATPTTSSTNFGVAFPNSEAGQTAPFGFETGGRGASSMLGVPRAPGHHAVGAVATVGGVGAGYGSGGSGGGGGTATGGFPAGAAGGNGAPGVIMIWY